MGSAQVSANSASQPLAAVVNHLNSGAGRGASYAGLDTTSATERVSVPLVMAHNGPWYTAVTVQNVGSRSTAVSLNYSDGSGPYTETLAPRETWVLPPFCVTATVPRARMMVHLSGTPRVASVLLCAPERAEYCLPLRHLQG